jgi:RNA polymerase sigma-70 factor (ECF subfamily)
MKDPGKEQLTDERILELVLSGDKETRYFEILYKRYHSKVKNKCFSIVQDHSLATDLVDEVFSKVYEKLSSFKGQSLFSTWLYSITYNYCIDYLRVQKKMHYPEWNSEHEMHDIPDIVEDIEEEIDYDRLIEIMQELHPEERALIQMKYMEDQSLKSISEVLRITESATKMRLKRAKTRLLFLYSKKYMNNK